MPVKNSKRKIVIGSFIAVLFFCAGMVQPVRADELTQDQTVTVKATVTSVKTKAPQEVQGFDNLSSDVQTITAKIEEGMQTGKSISFDNDYVQLKQGDSFFLTITTHAEDNSISYSVEDPNRLPTLGFFAVLFVLLVIFIGGKQGVRGLVTLIGSFVLILYALVPGILHGYSPVLIAIIVSSLIIVLGSYVTHGFNRTTSCAVGGMIATVIVTGVLAFIAVHTARFTGYGSEEATYLHVNTFGHIDMLGLLLGGIMIGLLGVLYDVAISQAITVEELHHIAPHIKRVAIFKRSMRVGREHIGALVNTLAIAYVGASLPLLLLFSQPPVNVLLTVNHEIFAAEILRILIGSIGLVLAVPIVTALAVFVLVKEKEGGTTQTQDEQAAIEKYAHHH